MGEVLIKITEQEITLCEPRLKKGFGVFLGNTLSHHQGAQGLSGVLKCLAMQLDAPDCRSKPLNSQTIRLPLRRRQQPLYGREHEISVAKRRFKETETCQGLINRISHQIKNELDNLPLGVDGPALLKATVTSESLNGICGWTKLLEGRLNRQGVCHGALLGIERCGKVPYILTWIARVPGNLGLGQGRSPNATIGERGIFPNQAMPDSVSVSRHKRKPPL